MSTWFGLKKKSKASSEQANETSDESKNLSNERTVSGMITSAKSKANNANAKLKGKFAVQTDVSDLDPNNVRYRSDELSHNPLTALYLALQKGIWDEFPQRMKFIWIAVVLMASSIQWCAAWGLSYYYFDRKILRAIDVDINDAQSTETTFPVVLRVLSGINSSVMLFVYVLNELQSSLLTLRHYWAILEVTLLRGFLFCMFVGDILLLFGIAIISVIAIEDQDDIVDQLGISLSFFFILEFDEWMYNSFMEDFNALEADDFVLQSVDMILDSDDLTPYYIKKSNNTLKWGALGVLNMLVVLIYYLSNLT